MNYVLKFFVRPSLSAILCVSPWFLLLTSCSDFLEREVKGNPDSEDFYNTIYELQEGLNAVYDVLQSDQYTNCEWIFGEACGDDVVGTD